MALINAGARAHGADRTLLFYPLPPPPISRFARNPGRTFGERESERGKERAKRVGEIGERVEGQSM